MQLLYKNFNLNYIGLNFKKTFSLIISLICLQFVFVQNINAAEKFVTIKDHKLPKIINFVNYNQDLRLQGAGIRSKFIVDVYVGGLYLEQKTSNRVKALNQTGAKRMYMGFLRQVSAEKMQDSWRDGIKANNDFNMVELNKKNIATFINFFQRDIKKGDIIFIDNIPNEGVAISLNNVPLGVIKDNNFYKLVLSTWLGSKPPSSSFQKDLLGR